MDDILLAQERAQQDNFSLSHALENRTHINTDIASLMNNARHVTKGVREDQMKDIAYLDYKRRTAESTLIKSKIIYKVHKDIALTENEQAYLKRWVSQA